MKYLFVTAFVLCSLFSSAQNKYVQKLYAYYESKGADTTHFIYVEVAPDVIPIWDTAVIAGDLYAVHSTLVETIPLQVGEGKRDKRMIVIRPQPDNKLYQLEFDLVEEKAASKTGITSVGSSPVLKGTHKTRKITYTVRSEVELVSPGSF